MAGIRRAITVEDLLALNDEMRSLARAGVPLEHGLRALGGDLPGRLGHLATAISDRMERGESLVTVLRDPNLRLPPVYSAVVAAGVRTGRLASALESLTQSVQRATDLRRTLIVALVYPLIVFSIATTVFTFTWTQLFPVMRRILPSLLDRQEMPQWFQWLTWSVDQGGVFLNVTWIVIVIVLAIWFIRSHQALQFGTGYRGWPSIGMVNAAGRSATFAETLALLIEHQVPLAEALSLSGAASGDRRVQAAADQLAARVTSGQRVGATPPGLPPLLSWLILTNAPTPQLVKALRQTAVGLRERALRASIAIGVYLPIMLSASLGAVIAIYYAILVMIPFYYLMLQLGQP